MNYPLADRAAASSPADNVPGTTPRTFPRRAACLLLLAAAGVPASLLWDFSWESTVGIDLVWAPPHIATYLMVALAGLTALGLAIGATHDPAAHIDTIRLGRWYAPFGAWLAVWGALAFSVAVLFDRWWQSAYGLAAGIWHPPQIVKAIAFFAVVAGAWLLCLKWQNQPAHQHTSGGAVVFAVGGSCALALITVVTLTSIYPNRQHSAPFYYLACASYPIVLVALATAGKCRWTATLASALYTGLLCVMVWLLPLFPAKPLVAPIYNLLDHLMPPPFPLLLVVPAMGLDMLLRIFPWPAHRLRSWYQAGAAGLVFFVLFIAVQWMFADFLLGNLADHWFFAGGGTHWPFFLKIDPLARVTFWETAQDAMTITRTITAAGLAVLAARAGLWAGDWMAQLRR